MKFLRPARGSASPAAGQLGRLIRQWTPAQMASGLPARLAIRRLASGSLQRQRASCRPIMTRPRADAAREHSGCARGPNAGRSGAVGRAAEQRAGSLRRAKPRPIGVDLLFVEPDREQAARKRRSPRRSAARGVIGTQGSRMRPALSVYAQSVPGALNAARELPVPRLRRPPAEPEGDDRAGGGTQPDQRRVLSTE